MKLIKNKKGIGIPTLLLIVTFLLGTGASLLTLSYQQSSIVERNIQNTEAYSRAVYNVDATLRVMVRELNKDNSFLNNADNISFLEDYFEVDIERYPSTAFIWTVSARVSDSKSVKSFLSANTGVGSSGVDSTDLLSYFGAESTSLSDVAGTLLGDFLDLGDEDDVKKIIRNITRNKIFLQVTQSQLNSEGCIDYDAYFSGNLTIHAGNTLCMAEGRILVITNNLTMQPNSNLYGNVVVNNNVTFKSTTTSHSILQGTMYVGNHFDSETRMTFGTAERPTFIFSQNGNTLEKSGTGYAYFVAPSFTLKGSSSVVSIYGGVYASNISNQGTLTIEPFDLSTIYHKFKAYALPTYDSMTSSGDYTYTSPQIG